MSEDKKTGTLANLNVSIIIDDLVNSVTPALLARFTDALPKVEAHQKVIGSVEDLFMRRMMVARMTASARSEEFAAKIKLAENDRESTESENQCKLYSRVSDILGELFWAQIEQDVHCGSKVNMGLAHGWTIVDDQSRGSNLLRSILGM